MTSVGLHIIAESTASVILLLHFEIVMHFAIYYECISNQAMLKDANVLHDRKNIYTIIINS